MRKNSEEKQSIFELCEQYSEIFHLEGDRLTFTNAANYEIKLNGNQPAIYRRPYKLPQAQQEEINFKYQIAFDKLKSLLCTEPILKYPDFTKTFILTTDASNSYCKIMH